MATKLDHFLLIGIASAHVRTINKSIYAMIWMGMNGGIGGASVIMVSDRVQMVAFARPWVWAQKKPD